MAEMELPPVRAGHIFSVQRISSVFVINPHKPMRHIVLDEEAFPGLAPEKVDCGDYIAKYSVVLRIVLGWLIAKKTPPDWNVDLIIPREKTQLALIFLIFTEILLDVSNRWLDYY
jgi:hypothetical protein